MAKEKINWLDDELDELYAYKAGRISYNEHKIALKIIDISRSVDRLIKLSK